MDISERELEDMLFDAAQTVDGQHDLRERGLPIHGKMIRQQSLCEYGRADLLTIERQGKVVDGFNVTPTVYLTIYELKKGEIGFSALGQVDRYRTAAYAYAKLAPELQGYNIVVEAVLIGDSLDNKSDFLFTTNFIKGLYLCTYSFDYRGLKFKSHSSKDYFWNRENYTQPKVDRSFSFWRDVIRISNQKLRML